MCYDHANMTCLEHQHIDDGVETTEEVSTEESDDLIPAVKI
jgi:hypothetical protein